jgi:cytochrome c7-like protein/class III cytochrome C family protein
VKRYVAAAIVMGVVAAAWLVILPPASARQPLAFPHAKHQSIGCAVCHRGAATAVHAGIPDVAFCTKCHATPPAGTTAIWDAAVTRKSIGWVQVTHVPSHVMFSHRRHTTLGRLDCASCHGEMRDRRLPPGVAPVRLVMNTCLSCHRHEGAAEDCAACHR